MKPHHDPNSESLEKDPVWSLLKQSPMTEARPSFADDVVRAARLQAAEEPWWRRFRAALAVGALTSGATALIVGMLLFNLSPAPEPMDVAIQAPEPAETLDSLDEIVRTEALFVAAEEPSAFSDAELVSLISY